MAYRSQFGPGMDIVAPSGSPHLGVEPTPPPTPTLPEIFDETEPLEVTDKALVQKHASQPSLAEQMSHLLSIEAEPATSAVEPVESATKPAKSQRFLRIFARGSASVFIMTVMATSTYIGLDTWTTNTRVNEVIAHGTDSGGPAVLGSQLDETPIRPSAIDAYAVASDMPRVLSISDLDIRGRVLPVSVDSHGAVESPTNIFDSGWYTSSARPGQPGAAFINAHASGVAHQGLFGNLAAIQLGSIVSLEMGDGSVLEYRVQHVEQLHLDSVDMRQVLETYNGAVEGLNLMTCSGQWIDGGDTLDQRIIVYTERVK